jgi:hypothetical protein
MNSSRVTRIMMFVFVVRFFVHMPILVHYYTYNQAVCSIK